MKEIKLLYNIYCDGKIKVMLKELKSMACDKNKIKM